MKVTAGFKGSELKLARGKGQAEMERCAWTGKTRDRKMRVVRENKRGKDACGKGKEEMDEKTHLKEEIEEN